MIQIQGLSKSYGKKMVLDDFSLTIKSGSIFGLIGINGAGKSTLLRLMSGILKPEGGTIIVDGQKVFDNEVVKKDIFFLPDEPFYTHSMTGRQMADFYKAFYNFDNDIFERYVAAYKLCLKTAIRTFSKGMKRRLFVCIAFACVPKYLLLDEVFDGLDPAARLIFKRGLIDTLERTGGTAVLASHSLRELQDICDSYGLIDGQRLASSGDVADAIEKICKFQIAFNRVVTRDELGFDVTSFESTGKIIKITIAGEREDCLAKINSLNPLVVDEIAVDLEEFFISEVESYETQSSGGAR